MPRREHAGVQSSESDRLVVLPGGRRDRHLLDGVGMTRPPHCSLHAEEHEPGSATCVEMTVARANGSGVVPDKPALAEAVRDVLWRAQRFGETDDGDTAHYIVTKGAMHRLMGAAQAAGIPASFRNDDSIEVPDKPALAPSLPAVEAAITAWNAAEPVHQVVGASFHASFIEMLRAAYSVDRPNASVPAVTDDEAATKVIESAVLLGGREWDRWPTHPKGIQPRFNFIAERVVADLRSAGFLIVHHTKET